jgi:hypothetical protein
MQGFDGDCVETEAEALSKEDTQSGWDWFQRVYRALAGLKPRFKTTELSQQQTGASPQNSQDKAFFSSLLGRA